MIALAATIVVVQDFGGRRWAEPLRWLGINPLAIYFLSEGVGHLLDRSTAKSAIFWDVLYPAFAQRAEWASLAFAVVYVAVWIAVAGILDWQGIYISV